MLNKTDRVQCLAFVVFALCLLLLTNLIVFYQHTSEVVPVTPVTLNVARVGRSHLDDEQLVADMLFWPSLVQSAHIQARTIPIDNNNSEYKYLHDCWNDPDWFRMVNNQKLCYSNEF